MSEWMGDTPLDCGAKNKQKTRDNLQQNSVLTILTLDLTFFTILK